MVRAVKKESAERAIRGEEEGGSSNANANHRITPRGVEVSRPRLSFATQKAVDVNTLSRKPAGEWLEEDYPPYANGPGYVVSSDIARFVVSEFEKHTLRLFKIEDVSMSMWVEQLNSSRAVEYVHSARFCQFGCIDDYLTSHYQSPRKMLCMWDRLQEGKLVT